MITIDFRRSDDQKDCYLALAIVDIIDGDNKCLDNLFRLLELSN